MRIFCAQIGVPDRGAPPAAAGFWLVEPLTPGTVPFQLDAVPPPVQPATASARHDDKEGYQVAPRSRPDPNTAG